MDQNWYTHKIFGDYRLDSRCIIRLSKKVSKT